MYRDNSIKTIWRTKMKIPYAIAITVTLVLNPMLASAAEGTFCDGAQAPLTTVADFDGNGVVNSKDIAMIAKNVGKKGTYSPLYDRNGDGKLNGIDVHNSSRTMGKTSTTKDREIATASNPCVAAGAEEEATETVTAADAGVTAVDTGTGTQDVNFGGTLGGI